LARAVQFFEANHSGETCTPDEAAGLAKQLDSGLAPWKAVKLREETEPITKDAFAKLVLKYGVAGLGMGVFFVEEVY
jgi:hypothetical protein